MAASPRHAALAAHLRPLDTDPVALGLVDALLAGDRDALEQSLAALRAARSGDDAQAATALAAVAHWAVERLPAPEPVASGTHAAAFLSAVGGGELSGGDLRAALGTDETQVSRTARRLLDAGLVTRRKAGRQVFWALSPRGRAAAASPGPAEPGAAGRPDTPADARWWRDVIATAYAEPPPSADPSEHTTGDPERDRVLTAAVALHLRQGVLRTTWPQIAKEAGLPVATVERHFPTVDELVPACTSFGLRRLHLPPPERAEEPFAGVAPDQRLERLVDELFAAYERGGRGVEVLKSEGDAVVTLGHARDAVDASLDALVRAALPEHDDATVALARALTDVSVWRSVPRDRVLAALTAAVRGPA